MNSSASRLPAAVFALALLGAGTVGAQAPERWPGGTATPVVVTLTDTALDVPSALPPGLVAFRVTNAGNEAHNFEIGGEDLETRFARNLAPGETRELRVYLAPGSYTAYCPVEGHSHPPAPVEVRYAERIR